MQHGESHAPIVGDMHGLSFYRGAYATYAKRKAQRTHRHRVNIDMKLIAREAMNEDDFETQSIKSEACDAWDIW